MIRQYYQPLQPVLDLAPTDEVVYQEHPPHEALRAWVYCYWELTSQKPLQNDFSYRVVSDGCIDILLEVKNPEDIFITGLSTQYLEFPLGKSFRYFGIRFLPTGYPQLFHQSAGELTNQFLSLDVVLPKIQEQLSQSLRPDMRTQQMVNHANQVLLKHLRQKETQQDERLSASVALILENQGNIPISELKTGLSPRQLRRLSHFYLGESAKAFSKLIRFQSYLRAQLNDQEKEIHYFDLGYYDQAHFIKEFKHYFGLTPKQVL